MQPNTGILGAAQSSMQELCWELHLSFDKAFDDNIDFFTIGDSIIGGTDFLPGTNNVVQEWDKYIYEDFSDRVISLKWEKEKDNVSSVVSASADIVLNNYDDMLSSGNYLYTSRPIKIFFGYNDEVLAQFVGVTRGNPIVDDDSKTVQYHCTDFFGVILDKQIDTIEGAQDVTTDEALAIVLEQAGLLSTQYVFDPGFNTVPFFYSEKGVKVRHVVEKLMLAEQGSLYMDEQGVVRFENRQHYNSDIVQVFDAYNSVVEAVRPQASDVINVVTGSIDIRAVQDNQLVYQSATSVSVPASGQVTVWADFVDPIISVDTPVYVDSATTSSFSVNTQPDGSGSADSTSVTVDSTTTFGSSYKIVFDNSSAAPLYVTDVVLYGVPAKVVTEASIREEDSVSVSQFEERAVDISSDFFQSVDEAESKAQVLIQDFAENIDAVSLRIKGNPALQLGDVVSVDLFGRYGVYQITKISDSVRNSEHEQRIRVKAYVPHNYFTIGESLVGGTDEIAP